MIASVKPITTKKFNSIRKSLTRLWVYSTNSIAILLYENRGYILNTDFTIGKY